MTFELYPLRFHYTAREAVRFPAGKAGNAVRGALGVLVDAAWFAPRAEAPGPSGLADPPRPFVLRAAHLDGHTVAPGESFHVDLHWFATRGGVPAQLTEAFAEMGRRGLGPGRGRADLVRADVPAAPLALSLEAPGIPVSRLTVEFLTPTELKGVDSPEFAALFARVRDRVTTLRALYGAGPLDIDYRGLGDRAAQVTLAGADLRRVQAERRSSRTGHVHPLGGFVGKAEYAGDLTEFFGWLKAAEWTGVGRQTVWGKGAIQVLETG